MLLRHPRLRPQRRPLPWSFLLRASAAVALAALVPAGGAWAEDARARIERGENPHMSNYEAPEWKEAEVPPPPQFEVGRLMALEMPPYMSLKFGVDPKTITIAPDGVVRYVVVAYRDGSDTVNAFYEGVRCSSEEYKTYARYTGSGWSTVPASEWKRIDDRNSIYTAELARQSLCQGHAPRGSVNDMLRELRRPETQGY